MDEECNYSYDSGWESNDFASLLWGEVGLKLEKKKEYEVTKWHSL